MNDDRSVLRGTSSKDRTWDQRQLAGMRAAPVAPKAPRKKSSRSELGTRAALSHACPECDFVTADAAEAARHLTLLITGHSECGTARSRPRRGKLTSLPLGPAVDAFLETIENSGTARAYRSTLRSLIEHFGTDVPVDGIPRGPMLAWFRERWEGTQPTTWNRNASAVKSFFAFCRAHGWCNDATATLLHLQVRRDVPPQGFPSAGRIAAMLSDGDIGLRERALWSLLFDAAANPGEVLALNVQDLDLSGRCAATATRVISWSSETNRLLALLLASRTGGPVFLTDRKARVKLNPADIDAVSGRARLSYRRAAEVFEQVTAADEDGPWTLRQLRTAALAAAARRMRQLAAEIEALGPSGDAL